MTDVTYTEGDTVRLSIDAEVVWHDKGALCVAVPGVDQPFIVPVRTDDGEHLGAVYVEPALPDVRIGDVFRARLTGYLWLAVNAARDELAPDDIRLVSAQDGKIYDPSWVAREYGPLHLVTALLGADDRPVMFHLPDPELPPAPPESTVLHPEDLADPLPETVPVDPTVPLPPLPDDVYLPPMPPPPIVLASASSAPGEIDDTAVMPQMFAVVKDDDPSTVSVRTVGQAGEMQYMLPILTAAASDVDRFESWTTTLRSNGWERTGSWRWSDADAGHRMPVRPARRPEPPVADPAQGEAA
jgi:hypothetical protein